MDRLLARAPEDVELIVLSASLHMRLARIQLAVGRNPSFSFEDVVARSREALQLAPDHPRAVGYHAWASYMLSDTEKAGELASRGVELLLGEAATPLAAQVLAIFAANRTRALYAAIADGTVWDPSLVADARAAYRVLLEHPAGNEGHAQSYLQMLAALSAFGAQRAAIRAGLERYPVSPGLHSYLRQQVLRDEGARALEAVYRGELSELRRAPHAAELDWFEGLAAFMAAEQDVQNRSPESALDAYARSLDHFQRSLEAVEDFAATAHHYQALALAGRARLLALGGSYAEAVAALVESLSLAPASRESQDGLGKSPLESARDLRRELRRQDLGELVQRLDLALDEAGSLGG